MAARSERPIVDLDGTVEIPVSALLDAAAAFYAIGNLFPFVGGSEPQNEHLATIPARDLLLAAGLVRITGDYEGDFSFGSDEGWNRIAASESRIMARLLTELASRSTAEAARLAEAAA
jgi:hypothetical protein